MVQLKGLAGNLPKFSCLSYAVFQENYYYICVIDLFSCKVIAIQFSKNSTRLVTSTFKQVVIERSYSHSLIFHSDRGFQYLSHTFQQLLHLYKVKSSLHHIVRAVQEQVHQLTLLSSDGQQQELCRWKQDERSEMFMNGNMYYWDKETNGLYCWDLESDTPECLFAGPIRFDDEVSYDQLSLSADSFDGHLLATAVQDSDGQAVSCAFDPISKSLQKLTLTSDDEKSVLILAEGSEYFLVRYGLMEYEVPDYAPDGREITTTMLLPNLRLIAKSDYWNNIPNYILLDDYVYSKKS